MGWLSTYVGYTKKSRKDLYREFVETSTWKLDYIEEKGSTLFVVYKNTKTNKKFCGVVLTQIKNGEFSNKEIAISSCPYSFNCSKKFLNMVMEIEDTSSKYVKDWLDGVNEYNEKSKNKRGLLNNLKTGDTIEFLRANFGDKKQWTVSNIIGNKVYFEGYILKGWKSQEFIVVK